MADWIRYNSTSKLYEISVNSGGSFATLDLDAAQITSGAFADARIPNLAASKITSGLFAEARISTKGDFTPVIGGSTSESGQTYSSQVGKYATIGPMTFVTMFVQLSAKGTITGDVTLKGFPIAPITNGFSVAKLQWGNLNTNYIDMLASFAPGATTALLLAATAADNSIDTVLAAADIADNSYILLSGFYRSS